jgi:hypothetical protein
MSITCEVHCGIVMITAEAIAVEKLGSFFVDRFAGVVIIGELPGEQMFKFKPIGPVTHHLSHQEPDVTRRPVNSNGATQADNGFAQRFREYP